MPFVASQLQGLKKCLEMMGLENKTSYGGIRFQGLKCHLTQPLHPENTISNLRHSGGRIMLWGCSSQVYTTLCFTRSLNLWHVVKKDLKPQGQYYGKFLWFSKGDFFKPYK
ncbi:hypothetical protein CHARACLAT_006495 [Characodon lateralis]|uniref:Uncharacterized protein n=1 Tax=Characodon lateralis TaxID=208331 RepID=A0ABU7EHH6_9TELE|nr:hypothetical protein [Characodon lateralis]